jgi:hypothetical protein
MLSTRRCLAALAILGLAASSCASSDDEIGQQAGESSGSAPASTTTSESTAPPTTFAVASADLEGPITEPNSPNLPQPASALPEGYVLEEFFIGGEASSFELTGEAEADGMWSAEPAGSADYRTRILVRRPPPERFSGVVVVEWLNVSSVESSPDWAYLSEEIGRSGHAHVSVSAQAQGITGSQVLMPVEVNEEEARTADQEPEAADASGLIAIDPARYGSLEHPGDEYSYDIYSQVGRALRDNSDTIFDSPEAPLILGLGESQSASFLSTYVNAVHPLAAEYDGFMVHSRGAGTTPIGGDFMGQMDDEEDSQSFVTDGVRVRNDLAVPVFIFESETDLTLLGYVNARQDDTDRIRTWEAAGTAHSDDHVFRAFLGGPRDPGVASFINCTHAINVGPQHEIYQAAFNHLVTWAQGGPPPPEGERILVSAANGEFPKIDRDEIGGAIGGVRNPMTDVPVFVTTGDPPVPVSFDSTAAGFDVCNVFGQTLPIAPTVLSDTYASRAAYLEAFEASAETAVQGGYLLPEDAAQLLVEAANDFAPLIPEQG